MNFLSHYLTFMCWRQPGETVKGAVNGNCQIVTYMGKAEWVNKNK